MAPVNKNYWKNIDDARKKMLSYMAAGINTTKLKRTNGRTIMMRKEDNGSMAARLSLAAGVLLMLLAGATEARDPNNKYSEYNIFLRNLEIMSQRIKEIMAGAALLNKTIPTYSQYSFESYIDLSEKAVLDSEFDRIVTQYIPFVEKRHSKELCEKGQCGWAAELLPATQQVCFTSYSDYKADWATPFDPQQTSKGPFYRYEGSVANITVMSRTGSALYKEDKDQFKMQMLTLPFASLDSVLILMKPNDGSFSIDTFAKRVYSDFENLVKNVIYQQAPTNVTIRLPKFKVAWDADIAQAGDILKKIWNKDPQTAILKNFTNTYFTYFKSNMTLELNEEGINYQADAVAGNVDCQKLPERKIPTLKKSDVQSPFAVPKIVNLVAGIANGTLKPASEAVVEFSGDEPLLYMILTTDLTVLTTGDYNGE